MKTPIDVNLTSGGLIFKFQQEFRVGSSIYTTDSLGLYFTSASDVRFYSTTPFREATVMGTSVLSKPISFTKPPNFTMPFY